MKDYEGLSKAHFDAQAAAYDATNTAFYSKYPKISCADVGLHRCGREAGRVTGKAY